MLMLSDAHASRVFIAAVLSVCMRVCVRATFSLGGVGPDVHVRVRVYMFNCAEYFSSAEAVKSAFASAQTIMIDVSDGRCAFLCCSYRTHTCRMVTGG